MEVLVEAKCYSFSLKFFCVMGKGLSGKLSCTCTGLVFNRLISRITIFTKNLKFDEIMHM